MCLKYLSIILIGLLLGIIIISGIIWHKYFPPIRNLTSVSLTTKNISINNVLPNLMSGKVILPNHQQVFYNVIDQANIKDTDAKLHFYLTVELEGISFNLVSREDLKIITKDIVAQYEKKYNNLSRLDLAFFKKGTGDLTQPPNIGSAIWSKETNEITAGFTKK